MCEDGYYDEWNQVVAELESEESSILDAMYTMEDTLAADQNTLNTIKSALGL